MRLSVIITCFNLERFIGTAIRSVIDQDYRGPVEIIVVDDCSTDSSASIIQSFPQVQYVRTDRNDGVLLATLRGMEASTGELLFFLDGDDLWGENKLARCVAAFEKDPQRVLVTHDLTFVDAEGYALDRQTRPAAVLGPMTEEARNDAIIAGLCRQEDFIWLGSAWGIRRSLADLQAFGAWARSLPDPSNTYQDWPLAMWVASSHGARAGYVPGKLFRYRLHHANHSGDARTSAKAVRNFERARNTVAAMHSLAVQRALPAGAIARLSRRMRAYEYLASLYRGEQLRALAMFPAAAPDFVCRGRLAKEMLRLGLIQVLGPARATGLLARLAG